MPKTPFYNLGLIGHDIGYSLSPQIHHAALEAANLYGEYLLYEVSPFPDGYEKMAWVIDQMRRNKIQGLNITIPHKQVVLDFVDALTPTAQAVGAVNTLFWREKELIGDNTDVEGFEADLRRLYRKELGSYPDRGKALVFGAGGAARAIAYSLVKNGWHVYITARRSEQARDVATKINDQGLKHRVIPLDITNGVHSNLFPDLIINATPLGAGSNRLSMPWPIDMPFPKSTVIYDLIYFPAETMLVKRGRQSGLPATTGAGMLVEQAALSFQLWTGLQASRSAMFTAVEQELANRND